MKIFNLFRRKRKDKVKVEEEKMNLETAILLREVMTQGYMENWSVATNSVMSTLHSTVRHAVRLGYDLEMIVQGETYLITKENYRRSRVVSSTEKISDSKEHIKKYRLEISLVNKEKKGSNITLVVDSLAFNGLYIVTDGTKVDLTGTIPDCRAFGPICDIYKAVTKKKISPTTTGSNVVKFELPENKRKIQ